MKTATHRALCSNANHRVLHSTSAIPSGPHVASPVAARAALPATVLDDLVRRAFESDRQAIGAIAISYGPRLLEEARACLPGLEHEADDVLQDFLLALLERRSRIAPAHGYAIEWLCEAVRALARQRKREWYMGP
jgi:hypothetical protein